MITKAYIFTFLSVFAFSIDSSLWERFDVDCISIAINDEIMWKMTKTGPMEPYGYPIFWWNAATQAWIRDPYGTSFGVRVAIGAIYEWHINALHNFFIRASGTSAWRQLAYNVYEHSVITVGGVDYNWIIGTDIAPGGYQVYQYNSATDARAAASGVGAIKIAATPDGNAWIVTDTGTIKKFNGVTWITMDGTASDIIVGTDGAVYIVGTTLTDGGYQILKRNSANTGWDIMSGIGGVGFSLDRQNTPYVLTAAYEVYRIKGTTTTFCPSKLH